MPTLIETREQHRERVTRGLAEIDYSRRRARFLAGIDWQAMTRADRQRVEDDDFHLALCAHELGLEIGAIERGEPE